MCFGTLNPAICVFSVRIISASSRCASGCGTTAATTFPEIIVGYANNRTFHDPLHFVEITFNFFRVYVVAAGDDQILAAPDQGQISLGYVFLSRAATESA